MKKNRTYGLMENIGLLKMIKIMRFTIFILFLSLSQAFAVDSYSQQTKLSLDLKNAKVEDVLDQIEKKSEFFFMYNKGMVDVERKIDIQVEGKGINQILDKVFENTGISYSIKDRQILLINNSMVNSGAENITQQQKPISGKVTDSSGASLPGVSVVVKGTTTGVITDMDGKYSLSKVPENAILQFSFVGMKTQEAVLAGKTILNVTLVDEAIGIEEVVAVGYGTQKKANLTGAIEVITSKQLDNRPATNVTSLLQGNAGGIMFSSSTGGFSPGAAQTMQIRGSASLSGSTPPLIVIDGVPTDVSDFNTINPNDVENITVLKDAAASSIYGARAPYGVIIVTLKKGKRNQKPVLTYSGNYSLVKPINYPDPTDAYTFALSRNESFRNSLQADYYSADQLAIIKGNVEHPENYTVEQLVPLLADGTYGWGQNGMANTNWFKVWLKNSMRQTHQLSLRGGNEKTNYFASAGFLNQPGIFNFMSNFDNYKRFNINGGFNTDINNWIKLGFTTRYSYTRTKAPTLNGAGIGLLYGFIYGAWPTVPVKNPNGYYNWSSRIADVEQGGNSTDDQHRMDNVLELDLNPAKGWDIHLDGTWRMFFQDYEAQNKPVIQHYWADGRILKLGFGSLSKTYNINNYWTTQAYTSYNKNIGKHYIKVLAGSQAEETNNRGLSSQGAKMLSDTNYAINLASGIKTTSDAMSSWSTVGFFGRINYNFDERYLLELNGRYDGSCRYASEKRWGFFPSASVGWVLSKEKFWENMQPIVNYAKIRTSVGTLGDQGNTANFLYIPSLSVSPNTSWVFGNQTLPYVNTPGLLNPDITWSKISTSDLGIELKFLDQRLSSDFDMFRRKSWDILGPPNPVPSVLGTSAPQLNNAEFVTNGFELQLGWRDQIGESLNYGVRLTVSDAQSKITKYNVAKNYVGQWYPGMKLGEIWGYSVNRFTTVSLKETE